MATNSNQLPALLEQHKDELRTLLPKYIDADRFVENAKALASNRDLAQCSAESLLKCCIEAARQGWEVASSNKHCAVTPFKLKTGGVTAILMPQWQGRAFTWMKSGAIKKLYSEVVYEGDHFEIQRGTDDRIVHRPDYAADRSPQWLNQLKNIVGAYAVAILASNERVFAFVSRSQIARTIENVKKKNNGDLGFGWTDWLPEMCKKTAVHRLTGLIQPPPDMSPEQMDAWARASVSTQYDAVTEGREVGDEVPDNPPPGEMKVSETLTLVVEGQGQSRKTATQGNGSTPPADDPAVHDPLITDQQQIRLLSQAKKQGWTMQQIGQSLSDAFGIPDLSELRASQVAEFEAMIQS